MLTVQEQCAVGRPSPLAPVRHASPWSLQGSIPFLNAGGLLRRFPGPGPCPLLRRHGLVAVLPVLLGQPSFRLSAVLGPANSAWSDSSLGVVQRSPLHQHQRCASTPSGRSSQASPTTFGSRLPPLELVPSLLFLPASTVYSARRLAGLLRPAADHGVHYVSGFLPVVLRSAPIPCGLGAAAGGSPPATSPGCR